MTKYSGSTTSDKDQLVLGDRKMKKAILVMMLIVLVTILATGCVMVPLDYSAAGSPYQGGEYAYGTSAPYYTPAPVYAPAVPVAPLNFSYWGNRWGFSTGSFGTGVWYNGGHGGGHHGGYGGHH